ncbi:MAG: hypothetical protein KBB70_01155 [Candidatus Pacebacteria bacterium]|jgi:hypothetical protein|nr:hypothetical protein [Candidatus Paceibacterota bacterium]
MKYLLLSVAMLALFSLFAAKQTSAAPLTRPFGGQVFTNFVPGVVCAPPGMGPVYLMGLNPLDAGPYYTPDPKRTPRPGGYILGLYFAIPNPGACYTAASGAPYPVRQVTIYGVSR